MPTVLLINGQTQRHETDTITIGRGIDNTIALPHDQRLALLHAVLKSVAGRWIVESQGGVAVRVGNGRPTQFAWIKPGDVIHLTESGPELVFEPGGAVASQPAPAPFPPAVVAPKPFIAPQPQAVVPRVNTAGPSAAAPYSNLTLYVVAGGIAVFLLVGLGILMGGRGGAAGQRSGQNPEQANGADSTESAPEKVADLSRKNVPDQKPLVSDPRTAVFRLELQSENGKRAVQLGTAWAVGPRRLVTTGDAARGIALNQEFYPTAVARHALTHESFEISRMTLHPQYEAAANRLDQAVRKIEQLKSDYDETKDPSERKELENLARQQDAAAMLAAEEAVNVNVAVLDVSKDLSGALSWIDAPTASAKVGQKLTLVGHPLSAVDVLVDPDHPVPPEQRVGRLRHIESSPDPEAPAKWLVRFDDALKDQNWSGSPVIDSAGTVVGIYARPTPPLPGATNGAVVTHDVTVVESLRALMSGTNSQH